MKSEFSKTWKASKQPRKQRKYRYNAPLHVKRKFLSANLSKHLRKEYDRRSAKIRVDDIVRVMLGKYKGKEGKIIKTDVLKSSVLIEGVSKKKSGGKEFNIPIDASNIMIVEFNLKDEKRNKSLKKKIAQKKDEKPAKAETKEKKEEKTAEKKK